MFKVSITFILIHPCFQIEHSHSTSGRTSSEAWIKGIADEQTAHFLARSNSGKIIRRSIVQCKAMLEPIDEEELCINFQRGQCTYTVCTCRYKHYSCYEPDTCDDRYCWYGHSEKRTTVSYNRPIYRLENARYRIKLSNLPGNVTREVLIKRLELNQKNTQHLVLEPVHHENVDYPRMAYLIRQRAENCARLFMNRWHNTPFSATKSQKIQCQLEVSQDLFEWNDFKDETRSVNSSRCTSPTRSIHSNFSNRTRPERLYSSAASVSIPQQNVPRNISAARQSHVSKQISTNQPTVAKGKPIINSWKSRSGKMRTSTYMKC
ncbi:unnamed protein product [Adineta steineri]|uniref:Uncharacterized protein n=1 Tax=Adineta steineri TaxID=433720 RepID=A0A819D6S2_9BILA|nr:unnamed protein product [Adineta steineri]CAF3829651.1 unnamed protein product [Adineta steineri]